MTNSSSPEVSVGLPFRDAAMTIGECLESVRLQTLESFEVVAIDDGSLDESANIVRAVAAADARFRLLEPGRIGLVAALNLGLGAARAPLVARMDADDVMHVDRLRLQRDALASDPSLALVACQVELFPEEHVRAGFREYVRWQNECLTPAQIADDIYVEAPFAHPSVMYRRDVVVALGGYAEGDFPEDYELWLRMAHEGCAMTKIPRVLLRWREGEARATRRDGRYLREVFDRLRADYLSRDARIAPGREIVFWGAGRRTRQRARALVERGLRPSAYVDIDPDKIGRAVEGVPVCPPESLAREPRPFVLVLVTVHGARDLIAARLDAASYSRGRDYLRVG